MVWLQHLKDFLRRTVMVNHSGKDWKQGGHVGRWQNRSLGMQLNLSEMHSYPKIHYADGKELII